MMLYALGALQVYAPIFGDTIQDAQLAIVQANADGVKAWVTTVAELNAWAEAEVKPAAALAWDGGGDFAAGLVTKKPGKPALVPASDKRQAYNAAEIAFRDNTAEDR